MKTGTKVLLGAAIGGLSLFVIAKMAKAATPRTQYTCPICGEKFATPDELYQHMLTKHPGEPIPTIVPWQYGQPSGSLGYSSTPYTWYLSFTCKITNPNNLTVTKAVTLYLNTGPIDANLENVEPFRAVKTLNVTLEAGESFMYISEGEILVTWEQIQSRLNPYYAQAFLGFPCYLQDSDGEQSSPGTIF